MTNRLIADRKKLNMVFESSGVVGLIANAGKVGLTGWRITLYLKIIL